MEKSQNKEEEEKTRNSEEEVCAFKKNKSK